MSNALSSVPGSAPKVNIPLQKHAHRTENDGGEPLIIIETRIGLRLEENIVRMGDDFGRIKVLDVFFAIFS